MLTWSTVFGVVALGLVGMTFYLWIRANRGARQAADPTAEGLPPAIEERVVSEFPSPSEDEALKLVKQALQVREPAKVASFFRTGGAQPEEVLGFLRDLEKTDGPVTRYDWLSSMDANGILIDGVLVVTTLDGGFRNRLALMTPDDKGVWRIDFEAFARKVSPSWHDLLEKHDAQGTVRVIVAKDSYFNGPFREESEWSCFGMATPDAEGVMMGYCRKGSPQETAMKKIIDAAELLEGARAVDRATLEVRRVPGSESRQFEIVRVLAEDWIVTDRPFDEQVK